MVDKNGDDKFMAASKMVVLIGGIIVLGLVVVTIKNSQPLLPDHTLQTVVVEIPKPVAREPAPPAMVTPVSDTKDVAIGFRVSGRVNQLFFVEHAEVKQGEVLASLDKKPFEEVLAQTLVELQAAQAEYHNPAPLPINYFNAIEAAGANIEAAQHTYEVAHAELEKREKLIVPGQLDNVYNDDIQNEHDAKLNVEKMRRELEQRDYEASQNTDRTSYEAALRIAQNHVADAEANLANTELQAPASGIITSRVSDIGATVAIGAPVYMLSVSKTEASNLTNPILLSSK